MANKFQPKTFKNLLIKQLMIAILLGLAISIPLISAPAYFIFKSSLNKDIAEVESISYEAINTHLSSGWQKHNIENVYADMRQQFPNAALFLQKAPAYLDQDDAVIEPSNPTNAELLKLVKQVEKEERLVVETNLVTKTISAAIPIKFKNECLVCHTPQVSSGEIYPGALGGTMVLQTPMSVEVISTTSAITLFLLFLILFTVIAAFVTNKLVQTKLLNPLELLAARVKKVRLSSHERHIDWQRTPQDVIEIDHIDASISEHLSTVKGIYEKLDALMITEHETGVFHRDRFNEVLRYEMFRSHRYSHPFSLIVVKLNNVKPLNATAKNLEMEEPGSKYMFFANILHQDTRETDMSFRLEEQIFAIIAPETGDAGVKSMIYDLLTRLVNNEIKNTVERNTKQPEYEFEIQAGGSTYNINDELSAKDVLKAAIADMQNADPQKGIYKNDN